MKKDEDRCKVLTWIHELILFFPIYFLNLEQV